MSHTVEVIRKARLSKAEKYDSNAAWNFRSVHDARAEVRYQVGKANLTPRDMVVVSLDGEIQWAQNSGNDVPAFTNKTTVA